jgi:DNA repair protein RAD5
VQCLSCIHGASFTERKTRLRRAVLHPSLVLSEDDERKPQDDNEKVDVNQLIKQFAAEENNSSDSPNFAQSVLDSLASHLEECPICFDVMESPMLVPQCMHKWYVVVKIDMTPVLRD